MGAVQPHQPPQYAEASTSCSSSQATTSYSGSSPGRQDANCSQIDHVTSTCASSKATSPVEGRTPSTAFIEPEKDLQRNQSQRGQYPVVGQQISQLARQASTWSNGEPRPPSPHFPHAALALSRSTSAPGAIYIDWEDGDPECPMNWPKRKQWTITGVCVVYAFCTAVLTVAYDAAGEPVQREFDVSQTIFLLGNTTFLGAVAFAPLILAPFSELIGRKWIFNASAFLTALMVMPQALATNVYGLLFPRLVMGIAASCGNSLVGGILSDIFPSDQRGLPMSIFALVIFSGQGIGPLCASYTVKEHGWRISFWWQMAICFLPGMLMMVFFKETRGPVLLSRKAARMTKEGGGAITYRCRADDEKTSVTRMIMTSVSRPLIYLTSEPIVISFSLWIGTLWGTVFLSIGAVPIAFGTAYGWTAQQSSIVLVTLALGACFGWVLNLWQERIYAQAVQKHNGSPPPEVRMYSCCIGAVVVPIGLFIYAWGAQPSVHPAVPIVGLTIFAAGVYPVYLGVFVIMSGIYGRYASSALAAQSCLRNVFAAVSPLWTPAMYHNLGAPYATTILACIAAALGTCPFVLLFFGPQIRARSRVAKAMQKEEEELEEIKRLEKEKDEKRRSRREQKDRMLKGEEPFAQSTTDVEKSAAAASEHS